MPAVVLGAGVAHFDEPVVEGQLGEVKQGSDHEAEDDDRYVELDLRPG